ncbi:putative zinc transport protein ZntB (plasmid) [Phaeobacter gallaeciensis]|uniref:Zinc transport protein ZntB n=2 Tax=Phaeobacter gallaeciensis TaxID=60890 RepID=A0AAC9ZDL0_9RHOB|nr:putative zinc transport protein ZntB [Phaeobacter gallaeciensis]ATF08317.1 putative zinc transport protein ZntB [Phaeobacter gallaeciensis]
MIKDVETNPGFLHLYDLGAEGAEWLHMCIAHKETSSYLMDTAMLDDLIVDAMVEEDTRSRIRVREDGIMVLLKAMHVQCEDMAKPEDMVSIRIWIDETRVITTREADIDPILELKKRIEADVLPETPGAFLADLIEEHLDEISPHLEILTDQIHHMETMVVKHETEKACPKMARTQSQISGFLRHLAPQEVVLRTLCTLDHPALSERNRSRFDDALNTLLRYLETLQNLREQITILNEQISRIQDRQLSRSSYSFALAATVFLPLGFVTGLFGVNLPGIPMAENPQGFWVLFGLVCLLVAGLVAFLRWLKLL